MEVPNAEAGTYVLRVINYASATPTYTLTRRCSTPAPVTPTGKREAYTLTCEKAARSSRPQRVFIDRGQGSGSTLGQCRRRY